MGIDLSITEAVGVILDTDGLHEWMKRVDPEDNYWGEEYIDLVPMKHDGIYLASAGGYDDPDPDWYLSVNRLSKRNREYNYNGGIMRGPDPSIPPLTDEENTDLYNTARIMGTMYPVIRSFTAVNWS